MAGGGFLDYVRAAFLWRWNLLFFGAGIVFALLSGKPDMVLPLVTAGEIAYLGLLTSQPKFRKAIDVKRTFEPSPVDSDKLLSQIRKTLKESDWSRYEALRNRCVTLDRLALQLRGPNAKPNEAMDELQTGSLERLLWMFLKLLYSRDALRRFLGAANRDHFVSQIADGEREVQKAIEKDPHSKIAKSLQDKLQTLKQRLENFDRAADNLEFLEVELDRIEQKVNAIGELSLNAREPGDIAAQVDGITAGISATEEAMRSLDVAPIFKQEAAPRLLREEI
ncbi:MAG: hypothetical protein IT368_14675 [Candidatus Hydrogenedentes bacterium]|nr:hypothetical protein [Candidatus Hydrogenedentota bacterium]